MGLPITPFNPQQQDMLGTFARLAQIKNSQDEIRQRQALAPGQQQLQQAQITGAGQQNEIGAADVQLKNIQVKDQQTLAQLYPQFVKQTPTGGNGTTPTTGPTGYDFDGLKEAYIKAGGSMQGLSQINSMQSSNAELTLKLAQSGKATIEHQQAMNSAMNDAIETLQAIPDVQARTQQMPGIVANLQKMGVDTSKIANAVPSDQNLASAQAALGMHQQVVNDAIKLADLQKANAGATEAKDKIAPPTPQQLTDATKTLSTYSAIPQNMRAGLANELKNAPNSEALEKVQARADAANQSFQRSADARVQASTMKDVGLQQVMAGKLVTEDEKLGSALDQTSALRGLLDMSKGGNETATAAAQTRFAEHEIVEGGIKRMNQVEYNNLATNLGDYGRQFKAWADKGFQGQMPAATNAEMQKILDAEDASANVTHERNIGIISNRYGAAEPKPAAKSASPLPTSSPASVPKLVVGQRVSIKGKQMTVTATHPDGSFDAK